jgi:hypothetical protein
VGLGLERPALLKLLPHSPHSGDTKTEKFSNIPCGFALGVKFEDALARRYRDRFHAPYSTTQPTQYAT